MAISRRDFLKIIAASAAFPGIVLAQNKAKEVYDKLWGLEPKQHDKRGNVSLSREISTNNYTYVVYLTNHPTKETGFETYVRGMRVTRKTHNQYPIPVITFEDNDLDGKVDRGILEDGILISKKTDAWERKFSKYEMKRFSEENKITTGGYLSKAYSTALDDILTQITPNKITSAKK